MPTPIWRELFGQADAIAQLEQAVKTRDQGVQHAWLMTGPPGSGRSNMAVAFAAALLCADGGCGTCRSCTLAMSGNHPDIDVLTTEKVGISIEEVRNLVLSAQMGGSMGRYRIMIIEDADRMAERSSNVLLKALEEPPPGTVWILCAPSEADMLPTIRSRVRRITLKTPAVEEVAQLLVERDSIDRALAMTVAAEAQSHIGMARRLATSVDARGRRKDTLVAALDIDSVTNAMFTADRWIDLARRDAEALTTERDSEEREELLRVLGVEDTSKLPPYARADVKTLEESQKRRATRSLRDGLDRILVDLLSLYRDVLMLQLVAEVPLVNEGLKTQISSVANRSTAQQSLEKLRQIELARTRIAANVKDQMVLEALAVNLRTKP
ncbi:MAG: DNA polymerase III subunit delta' [Rhodoluna sp.]|nr:DNA polymerase III subunit delta' [Rhodoluna sp.]